MLAYVLSSEKKMFELSEISAMIWLQYAIADMKNTSVPIR